MSLDVGQDTQRAMEGEAAPAGLSVDASLHRLMLADSLRRHALWSGEHPGLDESSAREAEAEAAAETHQPTPPTATCARSVRHRDRAVGRSNRAAAPRGRSPAHQLPPARGRANYRLIVSSSPVAAEQAVLLSLHVYDTDKGACSRCGSARSAYASAMNIETTIRCRLGERVHACTAYELGSVDAALRAACSTGSPRAGIPARELGDRGAFRGETPGRGTFSSAGSRSFPTRIHRVKTSPSAP